MKDQILSLSLAALVPLLLWVLGRLHTSARYKAVRAAWGRTCAFGGSFLGNLGRTRLGRLWAPLETLLTDFLGFGMEQFLAGIRKADTVKMARQVERLKDVGSSARVEALVKVLESRAAEGRADARANIQRAEAAAREVAPEGI